jgi:hypothetical protein
MFSRFRYFSTNAIFDMQAGSRNWISQVVAGNHVDHDFDVSFLQFLPLLAALVLQPALNTRPAFVTNDRSIHSMFTFGIIHL